MPNMIVDAPEDRTNRGARDTQAAVRRLVRRWWGRGSSRRMLRGWPRRLGGEVGTVLTVMTWNVENFFVPDPQQQAGSDAKLDALAGVITDARPHLLAVQEVGDSESFEALRSRLG